MTQDGIAPEASRPVMTRSYAEANLMLESTNIASVGAGPRGTSTGTLNMGGGVHHEALGPPKHVFLHDFAIVA